MGGFKKQYMEREQERNDIELASKLGITVKQLSECKYVLTDDTVKGVYSEYVEFDTANSPKEILQLMKLDKEGRFKIADNSGE